MSVKHLLLATVEDAEHPGSWSGTSYNILQGLRQQVEKLSLLSRIPVRKTLGHGALRALVGPKLYPLWRTGPALHAFGAMLDAKVREVRPDAVLSISSQPLVRSAMMVPSFLISDAPWKSWRETYNEFDPEPWYAHRYAALEAAAARRCAGLFFASEFGVREAGRLYGHAAPRAVPVPFGANFRPGADFDITEAIKTRISSSTVELLFIGKDWERKGGPLALATADTLCRQGRAVRLHIVGCSPPAAIGRDYVEVHGLLSVTVAEQRAQLTALFTRCQFLLVPTRAECFGIVFAEAQTFGLVPVTRLVHATGDIVLDRKTGLVLPDGADGETYAAAIITLFDDKPGYAAVSHAAYARANYLFDWNTTARTIVSEINRAVFTATGAED